MLKIIEHSDASDFLAINKSRLLEQEATNNLLLGMASNLSKNALLYKHAPKMYSGLLEDQSVICGLQTPPRKLILHAEKELPKETYMQYAQYVYENNSELPGVVGPDHAANGFAQAWQSISKKDYRAKTRLLVYRLDDLQEVERVSGQHRFANEDDLQLLMKWTFAFQKELEQLTEMDQVRKMCIETIKDKRALLWLDPKPVSMSLASRPTDNGITVNYVFTPASERGKGYATSLVADFSEHLLKDYQFCTLFADQDNPTSNGIYQKIGYKSICAFEEIEFI